MKKELPAALAKRESTNVASVIKNQPCALQKCLAQLVTLDNDEGEFRNATTFRTKHSDMQSFFGHLSKGECLALLQL